MNRRLALRLSAAFAAALLSGCATPGVDAAVHRDAARLADVLSRPHHGGENLDDLLANSITFDCPECVKALIKSGVTPDAKAQAAANLFRTLERRRPPEDQAPVPAPPAPDAAKDAAAVADYLAALGVPRRNIASLTGSRATRTGKDSSGRVTLKSVSDFMKAKVGAAAPSAGRVQNPRFLSGGTATDDVVLRAAAPAR